MMILSIVKNQHETMHAKETTTGAAAALSPVIKPSVLPGTSQVTWPNHFY
jgi:hypothetical protein